MLLGRYLLGKRVGGKMLYDIRASSTVKDPAQEAGGEALVERLGHAFTKRRTA